MAQNPLATKILDQNRTTAANHQPIPFFSELSGLGVKTPNTIILTCVDPRVTPEKFLDLSPAINPITVRNICGHAGPAIADIAALDAFMGIENVVVIHHTDCGALSFTEDMIKNRLKERLPEKGEEIDGMVFGAINNLEQSVRDDLDILRASPYIRKELAEKCIGFVYDIKTGLITPVAE
ncbi:carbonic anhydrase-6 [Coleophoma crateriformis]|uniref:Carbonic anhydrase n=1 Tax=Coleophoma crateriformis TaxID=565419 RepID=A0A3D8QI83_9HELO|nr:carbonic anhydrase-6 [Coleophoma crateriformis]